MRVEFTDASGAFRFRGVPVDQTVDLFASNSAGITVSLKGTKTRDPIHLEFPRPGTLEGKVIGLQSASFVITVGGADGYRRRELFLSPVGTFRMEGIAPGEVDLKAMSGELVGEVRLQIGPGEQVTARIEVGKE